MNYENISNTEISGIIDEWVKGERDRKILKRLMIDCISHEKLAEEFDLSVQNVRRIIYKNNPIINRIIAEK